jgi:polyether ionophore transport system permease protein
VRAVALAPRLQEAGRLAVDEAEELERVGQAGARRRGGADHLDALAQALLPAGDGLIAAGANCLPASLLFGALGALAFGLVPRASATVAYALVGAAFVLELVGALLDAPAWVLDLSPFHHVALVPAEPLDATAAAIMLAIAAAAALGALQAFGRRDLVGV